LRWQTLQWKQEATKSFLNGADIDSLEDTDEIAYSYAQVKSLATGNPLLIEETNLQNELNSLLIQERSHRQQQLTLQSDILHCTKRIKELLHSIDCVEEDIKNLEGTQRLSRRISEEEEKVQADVDKLESQEKHFLAVFNKATSQEETNSSHNALISCRKELKELKAKLKTFITEEDKLNKEKLKLENEVLSGQFALLNKDGGIAHGSTRLAGSYRNLEIYATNFGSSLNFAVKGKHTYGFPFRISQDRFMSLNRQYPIQSLDKFVDELPNYLSRLNQELEKVRLEQSRYLGMQGKEFPQIQRLNEVQARLIEIREEMSKQEQVLSLTKEDKEDKEDKETEEENISGEFWLLDEDRAGDDLSINDGLIEELKTLSFEDYVNERGMINYVEDVINLELVELRVIALTQDLQGSCKEGNIMKVARIYKSCHSFPEHWQKAMTALELNEKKVVIKTLAKLKAVAVTMAA
jgi:hypothetical protein